MTLSIPSRKAPAQNSFPTAPSAVAEWLDGLQPLTSTSSIRTLYRGLKHSNRLENNNSKRVQILAILEPAVDTVLDSLVDQYLEQPLPLPRKPANAHQLASDLLQEMGFAWKIVVNDTYASLLSGQAALRNIALFNALRVLAKLILHHSLIYSDVPEGLMQDANTLYKLAEETGLEDQILNLESFEDHGGWSVKHAYAHVQLLSMANLECQRTRNIPLINNFLEQAAEQIELIKPAKQLDSLGTNYAIHLEQDVKPSKWHYLLPGLRRPIRVFDTVDLQDRIARAQKSAPVSLPREQEGSRLNRHAFNTLSEMLSRQRERREQRRIAGRPVKAETGLKDICVQLTTAAKTAAELPQHWNVINQSEHGMCLRWQQGSPSALQVGELIFVHDRATNDNKLGVVHWIKHDGKNKLCCGIESLDGELDPVLVDGQTETTRGTRLECLIINRTVNRKKIHYLLAPASAYHESCTLRIYRDDQHKDWIVRNRISGSGSFDHWELLAKNPGSSSI